MTYKESLRHFETQQKRYKRKHGGEKCPHYYNAIAALSESLDRGDGWVRIKDRLPGKGRVVITSYSTPGGNDFFFFDYWTGEPDGHVVNWRHAPVPEYVTHWRELPQFPEKDDDFVYD